MNNSLKSRNRLFLTKKKLSDSKKILYKMLQVDEDLRPNFIELEKYILSK